jgi:hypothetical protein
VLHPAESFQNNSENGEPISLDNSYKSGIIIKKGACEQAEREL